MRPLYEGVWDNQILPIGFKVVTKDLKSLGLNNNPTIYTFVPGEWLVLPDHQIVTNEKHYGGIWMGKRPGDARAFQKYMKENHSVDTRIFVAFGIDILFENDTRFKTNGVLLMDEFSIDAMQKYRIRTILNPAYHRRST